MTLTHLHARAGLEEQHRLRGGGVPRRIQCQGARLQHRVAALERAGVRGRGALGRLVERPWKGGLLGPEAVGACFGFWVY